MLTTEKQAQANWCPMVRNAGLEGANRNADGLTLQARAACVGSNCMMWRRTIMRTMDQTPGLGYCGLAGRPETA